MAQDKEKERFVALAFCRADLLFELGDNFEVVFVAGATPVLFGENPGKIKGRNFIELIAPDDRLLAREMLGVAANKGRLDDVILKLKGPKGSAPKVALSGYQVPDFNNHFFLAIKTEPPRGILFHGGEPKRHQESGLLEADSFGDVAAERVKSYLRAGGEAQVTMVKVGKLQELIAKLNGDEKTKLLSAIGDILKGSSLGGDTASQVDQDSFSLAHAKGLDTDEINEQIEDTAQKIHEDGKLIRSIATTLELDGAGMSEEQVAKALIYTLMKFSGDNGVLKGQSLSDLLSVMMVKTDENVTFVKSAAQVSDFSLHFMPIFNLRDNHVHHFEGLMRFNGDKGKGSPYNLISLAEELGLISDFDMAVCKMAIEKIQSYKEGTDLPPIAVNVSSNSLCNDAYVAKLLETLKGTPDLAGKLMFEITESAKIQNLPQMNQILQSIRETGFQICLDDFGVGDASFDFLHTLDVDMVKFDGPVVKRACTTDKGGAFLKALADLCQEMEIKTVAEMVEDKGMANQVYYCGVDFGQGWHFGKPDPNPMKFAMQF